jgi:hypothetical protein
MTVPRSMVSWARMTPWLMWCKHTEGRKEQTRGRLEAGTAGESHKGEAFSIAPDTLPKAPAMSVI